MGFGSPTLEVEEALRKQAIRHVEPETCWLLNDS